MIVDRNSDGLLLATLWRVLEARRGPTAASSSSSTNVVLIFVMIVRVGTIAKIYYINLNHIRAPETLLIPLRNGTIMLYQKTDAHGC